MNNLNEREVMDSYITAITLTFCFGGTSPSSGM
jgi:hypothetical protein